MTKRWYSVLDDMWDYAKYNLPPCKCESDDNWEQYMNGDIHCGRCNAIIMQKEKQT